MKEKNYDDLLDKVLVVESFSILFLFVGLWLSYFFTTNLFDLIFSISIATLFFILYFFRKKIKISSDFFAFAFSFSIGIIFGSYLSNFEVSVKDTSLLAVGLVLLYLVVNYTLKIIKYKKTLLFIFGLIIVGGIIYTAFNFDNIIMKELFILCLYSLTQVSGILGFYFVKDDIFNIINIAYFVSYFVIFMIMVFLMVNANMTF